MGKHFSCDCGWAYHSLHVESDGVQLIVQVVNAPTDINLWQRLKAAWSILLGREHILSEVYLNRSDYVDFIAYLDYMFKEGNDFRE